VSSATSAIQTALQLIGGNIAYWRERRDISFCELAALSGITIEKLGSIEAGLLDPHLDDLDRLANALDIRLHHLFIGIPHNCGSEIRG
jgi:transcriptional regulator with XRE-family HTH domain